MNDETSGQKSRLVEDLAERLRTAVARTTRLNAEVTLLCEAALAAADELERLRAQLADLNMPSSKEQREARHRSEAQKRR